MADDRYYGEVLEDISLSKKLRPNQAEDVYLKLVETNSITGSSYSEDQSNTNLAFSFGTEHEIMNKEIILSPQNVLSLSDLEDYYQHFHEEENKGLFIPKELPNLEQCSMCGRYLQDYTSSEETHCESGLGYIWCFEYDRVLVFHGKCIKDIISVLEEKIKDESERFISTSI